MRVLITGVNGFVGGHLAEYLLAQGGSEVWGLSRRDSHTLAHLRDRVHLRAVDLMDQAALQQVIDELQPEVIYHLAGQPFVPESFRDPAATLCSNILGALHIFLAVIGCRLNCRVLVVGTNEEYGASSVSGKALDEDTPLQPISPYGVSKAAQSMLAQQYALSHKLDIVRARPFTHIGPRQNERFVTASFARQIARVEYGLQEPLLSVGNLGAARDFTDVRDIVRAYALLVEHGEAGAVYNIGTGRGVPIRLILDTLLSLSHCQVEIRPDPALMRPIDIPVVTADSRRLRERTGWQPQYALAQTLDDVLAYWREQTEKNLA
jgi:GDP-4-dehydro-6-deoxy-D-mannose reductase